MAESARPALQLAAINLVEKLAGCSDHWNPLDSLFGEVDR